MVLIFAAVMVFAKGIDALLGRQNPWLGIGVNRDPARMDPASGGVIKDDRVVAVRDLEAVVMVEAAAAGAE